MEYDPKNIIVPSFTYSFVKGKPFHKNHSNSEVGLFSEIFRKLYSKYRTNDPMFSICHLNNYNKFYTAKKINFLSAFKEGSIWEFLYNSNITVVNLGLDHLIISLIHYIEFICNVPYREEIKKSGELFQENELKKISYNFYARKLDLKLGLDWNKIEGILLKNNVIFSRNENGLNIKICQINEVGNTLIPYLKKDPYFLVKKFDT